MFKHMPPANPFAGTCYAELIFSVYRILAVRQAMNFDRRAGASQNRGMKIFIISIGTETAAAA